MTRFGRWLLASEFKIYALTGVVTSALTVLALQLWKADLAVPLTYRGDALPTGAHFKTIFEQGWYEYQPYLGAPWGQTYNDFPTADNLHMIAAKILGLFTQEWAVAINVYFLLGFPLAALAAVWFLRRCGVAPLTTVALATLFALAPYHFIRGESHLWLASYYVVPLALGLLVLVLRGEPLWGRARHRTGVLTWVLSPAARTVLIVALLATSSSYYAVFFLVLLAAAGLFALVRDRGWRRFWGAALAGVVTVVVMLINMLPDLLFSRANGQNPLGLERSAGEAEFYALKLSQLLLPWPGHRIEVLGSLRQRYDAAYVSLGEQPALGVVGAAGLVAALLVVAYLAFARVRGADRTAGMPRFGMIAGLSGLVFVAFLFSTLGGLSTIISIFTSSLRGWNRMSIVIAMLCLAIVGLLLDGAIDALSRRRALGSVGRRILAAAVAAVLLVIGFIDQTPGDADREYAGNAQAFRADAAYFADVESRLPAKPSVLLLPYVPFPESNAPTGLLASDQLVPYLHTRDVRWSNGGIKGRPTADWPGELEAYGLENVATLAAAAGFDAVLVDRPASEDHGAALEEALGEATGDRPFVSEDGRFAFYVLDAVRRELETAHGSAWFEDAREAITNPVVAYRTPGFRPAQEVTGAVATNRGPSSFSLQNSSTVTRSVQLSFDLLQAPAGATLFVTLPGGRTVEVPVEAEGTRFSARLEVEPGTHDVLLALVTADGAPVEELTITQPSAVNDDVLALLRTTPGS